MAIRLSDLLRDLIVNSGSIAGVAREAGIPQSTLQDFVAGKSDGNPADLRLSTAERLMDYFGVNFTGGSPANKFKDQGMYLKTELKAHGIGDSPEKFRERLLDALESKFPNCTIDDLLCEPLKAIEYCDYLRSGIGCEDMGSHIFLKTLVNLRKANKGPSTPGRNIPRKSLAKKLEDAGTKLEPLVVSEKIVDEFASMYKSRTVDDVLCYPSQAIDFCQVIRRKLKENLTDKLILQTLMNNRKTIKQRP